MSQAGGKSQSFNPLLKSYPDSDKLNRVSEGAECLYVRLIAQSDDYGRYYGEPRFVLAKLFTARMIAGQLAETEVSQRLNELFSVDLIRFYESGGARYIQMVNVHKRLRNDVHRDMRFPAPEDEPKSSAELDWCASDDDHGPDASRARPAPVPVTSCAPNPTQPNPDPTQTESTNVDSCGETKAAATEPLLTFPCDGPRREWHLTPPIVEDLHQAFPSLDILAECRKALAWVKASPQRRKTANGMRRFLVGWMGRNQDRGAYARAGPIDQTHHAGLSPELFKPSDQR